MRCAGVVVFRVFVGRLFVVAGVGLCAGSVGVGVRVVVSCGELLAPVEVASSLLSAFLRSPLVVEGVAFGWEGFFRGFSLRFECRSAAARFLWRLRALRRGWWWKSFWSASWLRLVVCRGSFLSVSVVEGRRVSRFFVR